MKRAKSNREIQRQRLRQERKALLEMQTTPVEQLRAAFYRNGITEKDVEAAYRKGSQEGRKIAEDFCFHTIYAAFLIVMEKHGIGADDAANMLIEIDKQTVLCVEDTEIAEEAYRKTGIQLHWDDPLERITREEET